MNPEILFEFFPFIIMFIIFPLIAFMIYKKGVGAKKKMERTAMLLGLESSASELQTMLDENPMAASIPAGIMKLLKNLYDPVYTGQIRGYDVKISFEIRGSSKSKTKYTVLSLLFPQEIHFDINIEREGAMSKLANLAGFNDINLNDKEFDSLLRIKGSSEAAVRDLLMEKYRRDALTGLFTRHKYMKMNRRGFQYERAGYINDHREVTELFNDMALAADAFKR